MKKISTTVARQTKNVRDPKLTLGLDLGDRSSWYCVLDEAEGRAAQVFDLADITDTWVPRLRPLAKGGSRECLRKWVNHSAGARKEISVQPTCMRTGPASSKR
jgi:hypothetical protein